MKAIVVEDERASNRFQEQVSRISLFVMLSIKDQEEASTRSLFQLQLRKKNQVELFSLIHLWSLWQRASLFTFNERLLITQLNREFHH